jgi:hypothetical protein
VIVRNSKRGPETADRPVPETADRPVPETADRPVRYIWQFVLAKIAVTLLVGMGLGFTAANALGANLTVTVSPGTVHPGSHYRISVSGSYNVKARGNVYLLAFIQYSGQACRSTGTAEYRLPSSEWEWDFYPQRGETKSPFDEVVYWKAGSRVGPRRVCAYMYAQPVTPSTTATPITRTSATFRNTKR